MQSQEAVVTAGYGGHVVMNSAVVVDCKPGVQILQVPQVPPPPYPVHILNQQINQQNEQEATRVAVTATTHNDEESTAVIENEETKAIYKHPLFPLVVLLFDKCEQATQTSECPSSDSINMEINSFVEHRQDKQHIHLENSELDQLMVKAIQVLRIHLLEMEKVNELCQDFCTRYISCLKSKLQNEQLLRVDGMDFDSPVSSPTGGAQSGLNTSNVVSGGGTIYQMIQTPQGLVAQPVQIQAAIAPASTVIQGATVLPQLGARPEQNTSQKSTSHVSKSTAQEDDPKSQRRGVLPKQATQVMKSWLFQHIVHPYPTEEEKKELSQQTGLSILQINNWFINARRRILQPMLESSTPDLNKSKKPKPPQSRSQKFWPDHLANYLNKQPEDTEEASMQHSPQGNLHTDMQETAVPTKGFVVQPNVYDMLHHVETNSAVQHMISNVQNATSVLVAQNGHIDDVMELSQSQGGSKQSHDVSEQTVSVLAQSHGNINEQRVVTKEQSQTATAQMTSQSSDVRGQSQEKETIAEITVYRLADACSLNNSSKIAAQNSAAANRGGDRKLLGDGNLDESSTS